MFSVERTNRDNRCIDILMELLRDSLGDQPEISVAKDRVKNRVKIAFHHEIASYLLSPSIATFD